LLYSELDLIDLKRLKRQLSQYSIDDEFKLDIETIVANYEHESIFMMFKEDNDVY